MPNIAVERAIYQGSSLVPLPPQEKPSPRGCHPAAFIRSFLRIPIADGGAFATGRAKPQDVSPEPADPPEVAALKEKAATAIRSWYGDSAAEGKNGVLNQPYFLVRGVNPGEGVWAGVDGVLFIGPETGRRPPDNPEVITSHAQVVLKIGLHKIPITNHQSDYHPKIDKDLLTADIEHERQGILFILNGTGKNDIGGREITGSILVCPTPAMVQMLHEHHRNSMRDLNRPSPTFLFVFAVAPQR